MVTSCQDRSIASTLGRRIEDLGFLPLSSESNCPMLGGAEPAPSSPPRRTQLKSPKAVRPLFPATISAPFRPAPAAPRKAPCGWSFYKQSAPRPGILKVEVASEIRTCPPAPNSQSRKLRFCDAEGLPVKGHKANPGRRGCRRRQSVRLESRLQALVGNKLRNRTPARQTGPVRPPLPPGDAPTRSTPPSVLPSSLAALAPCCGKRRLGCPRDVGSHSGGGGDRERAEAQPSSSLSCARLSILQTEREGSRVIQRPMTAGGGGLPYMRPAGGCRDARAPYSRGTGPREGKRLPPAQSREAQAQPTQV